MSCLAMSNWEIIFWDVGQGDATSVRLSDGSYILIDTGPNAKNGNPLSRWFAEQGNAKINKVVLTHNHRDHFGGLISLLEADAGIFEVLMVPDAALCKNPQSIDFRLLQAALSARADAGKLKVTMFDGAPYEIFSDGELRLLAVRPENIFDLPAGNENSTSMVVQLERVAEPGVPIVVWGGDALLSDVVGKIASCHPRVMVGPHHGSPQDKTKERDFYVEMLRKVNPACLYVSIGTHNAYQHPNRLYLQVASSLGTRVCCSEITQRCSKYRHDPRDVYPGSMMLGIPKPFGAIQCRGAMRVTVSGAMGLVFDECQSEFAEAVRKIENSYCGQFNVSSK